MLISSWQTTKWYITTTDSLEAAHQNTQPAQLYFGGGSITLNVCFGASNERSIASG